MAATGAPAPDPELVEIADYVLDYRIESAEARTTARDCLRDSLACAFLALDFEACKRQLGPHVPGTVVPNGARVPGTDAVLDPVKAARDLGTAIRWLDFNDTWLAAEWGHPSDNLGAILAVADWRARTGAAAGRPPPTMADVLDAMIRAHEIQGGLALENSFNRVGLDHVLLVRVASAAVATALLGGDRDAVVSALSHAFVDGGALRAYRQAPNAGPRKSWAAGDAAGRGVQLALLALGGEPPVPEALRAEGWGFYDVLFGGRRFAFQRPYGSYVMEQVLFKLAHPVEFHAQTAVDAAIDLHEEVAGRLDAIERIELTTHEAALRIIVKDGPLTNPAARDHCLQYAVAVALLRGALRAEDYEDAVAADPRIDALRARMDVREDPAWSRDYLDPDKRSIANAVQVFFRDGSATARRAVEYPLGHRRRREEGRPVLDAKFADALARRFDAGRCEEIRALCADAERLEAMPVHRFVDLLVP